MESNSFQKTILGGMNNAGKHVYAGTVDPAVVAKRRAKNRAARRTRAAQRRAA